MAVNKTRSRAMAKENYGDSEKVFSSEVRAPGLVNITETVQTAVDGARRRGVGVRVPALFRSGTKCFCPDCRKITDANRLEGTEYGPNRNDALYECGECGYTDRMIMPSSHLITIDEKKVDDEIYPHISFRIPIRRDSFVSSKDGRFTRFVDSCSYYEYEYTDDGHQRGFSRQVMRNFVDINGQSRSVQQMTMTADGELVATHHTADALNPNYHITRFPFRGDGLGFHGLGNVFNPLVYSDGDSGRFDYASMLFSVPDERNASSYTLDPAYERVRQQYGLPELPSIDYNKKMAVLQLSIMYPGVVDRELSSMDTNYQYAKERGDAVSEDAFAEQKLDKMMYLKERIALIDHNIASDLSKLKTEKQVTAYLRSIVFGEKPDIPLPKLMIDVTKSKMLDDGYKGKKLKTMYNKDPYGTASNVRTARKMGVEDPNHVNLLFECAAKKANRANKDGVLFPIETAAENRLVRTMVKSRGVQYVIKDIYDPDENGRDGIQEFEDSANMYHDMCKRGVVFARSKEEMAMVKYLDFLHSVEDKIDTPEHIREYMTSNDAPDWPHLESILTEMSQKIEEYKESGLWNSIFRAPRNGKPLFARDLRELHDELIYLQNRMNGSGVEYNNHYIWPEDIRELAEKEYDELGGYKFRLAKDSNELVRVGRDLKFCIGSPQYDRDCVNGHKVIVLMLDQNDNYVAACETDAGFKKVQQFFAYKDQYLYGELVPPARQWLADTGLKGSYHTEHFNEYAEKRLTGTDFSYMGGPERPERDAHWLTMSEINMGEKLAAKLSAEKLAEKVAREEAAKNLAEHQAAVGE